MKKGFVISLAGLLLIAAALLLTAFNMWDSSRAGEKADAALAELAPLVGDDPIPAEGRILVVGPVSEDEILTEIEYPDYVLNPEMDMPIQTTDGVDYVGVLRLPTLGKELPVINEWSYPGLKIAPCRYTGSAYLDNLVICAHNYSRHFGEITNLAYGDEVSFTDTDGNLFTYQVAEVETLQPMAVEEMTSGEWDLTLFTCTIGGRSRVTVRCERMD